MIETMPVEPLIRPLSVDENIYALCDEFGRTIGTGTREVCEVLLFIIKRSIQGARKAPRLNTPARPNVRAAMTTSG